MKAPGPAVGSFPATFPNQNEAVIAGPLSMAVDVVVQPDGTVKVVGLSTSLSGAGGTQRSSDILHRVSL